MPIPWVEFRGNKRLLWIAQEWKSYSEQLAEWAMERLVNRRDVWSQYTVKSDGKIGVVQLPIKERRALGTDMVTLKKLARHFGGEAPSHLIGLHSISDHSTCKWFAIDVDLHDETVANADEIAQANLTACREWAARLREQGLDPIIFDSNGVGGYHLWTLLDKEYPLADVYDFADDLRSDYQKFGLPRKPEIFPPKREVKPDDLPYALRLPGRHHTRHYYSRVWNFDTVGENEWLEGGEAIEAMLATRPGPLPKVPKLSKTKVKTVTPIVKKPDPKRKPRVCVDLDGVLAEYDGWKGIDHIGAPLPGALEFMQSLARIAEIVIFTARCSTEIGDERAAAMTPGQLRIKIIDWLEKNKFPYTDVYIGQGKPLASAFIDDRGVPCSPQKNADAYEESLKLTRLLLKRRKDPL